MKLFFFFFYTRAQKDKLFWGQPDRVVSDKPVDCDPRTPIHNQPAASPEPLNCSGICFCPLSCRVALE